MPNETPIERDDTQPYGIKLPQPMPWHDRPTVFKLLGPGPDAQDEVSCLNCGHTIPLGIFLADTKEGELNDKECPACKYSLANKKR